MPNTVPIKSPSKYQENKIFYDTETLKKDWIKLFNTIYFEDNFVPDIIFAVLRGGSFGANILSELYSLTLPRKKILFEGVTAHSSGIFPKVKIDGWTYPLEGLRSTDKIMLVDDLWDSGKTLTALQNELIDAGIPRLNIKVCVHDSKAKNVKTSLDTYYLPDYYCHLLEPSDPWIHYDDHEILDFSKEEIRRIYNSDKEIIRILSKALDFNKTN